MENEKKFSSVKDLVALLATKFPACFMLEGSCKPLKIGLFNELATRVCADDPTISKTNLRVALRFYTTRWMYLESVVAGAKRVDLDGNECDEVTQEHADYAATQLKESKERFAAKKEAIKAERAEKRAQAAKDHPNQNKDGFKKNPNGKPFKKNFNGKKNIRENTPKVEFVPLAVSEIVEGMKVHVLLGSGLLPATVREVAKDIVNVELSTGMVAKVGVDHIGK
jgi:ProP effector